MRNFKKKKNAVVLYSSRCAGGELCVISCLICCGEKTPSHFFIFFFVFFFFFFSPKPGLREGDKSLLFSVAKRTTGGFSRIYRPGGRGKEKKEDRGRDCVGEERRKDRRYCKVKVTTEPDQLQSITQDR